MNTAKNEKQALKLAKEGLEKGQGCQDENFSFIAGYATGGFPYGTPWEESDMELEEEDIF